MKIYTRTGDDGETGLFKGPRVRKDDVRIEAYGAIDELNAVIGLARSASPDEALDAMLVQVQNDLFAIGAEYATPGAANAGIQLVEERHTQQLEAWIDQCESRLDPLRTFILPGGEESASRLHVCRTTCRRAERRAWTLANQADGPESESLKYLNRLSDLLFVMARVANRLAGRGDIPWNPDSDPS